MEVKLKLNSGGSALTSRKALCGGRLCEHMGHFLGGFAMNLGSCPITIAEIWGAYYALNLA